MWILTIIFALAGLSLRADGGFVAAPIIAKGLFALACLSCPFLWAGENGLLPRALAVPGKARLMMGLALVLSAPLVLPWPG